ncbi:MAG: hypothetical protein PHS46_04585 [Candidatus Omnitrophica bacterium]|nr:hypothetical protein [Candidatus Omnitrophota bacterium]
MKKIFIAAMVFAFAIGLSAMGYCQDETADDRAMVQSESQMDSGLSSEIASDRAQSQAEVDQVDRSMDISGN